MKSLKKLQPFSWIYILIALLFVGIFLLNIKWGSTIFGLDNASPWFGFEYLQNLVSKSDSFFEFGPLAFSPFLLIGYALHLSYSAISQLVYWGNVLLGTTGLILLVGKINKSNVTTYFYYIFGILGSLVTIWVFAQPTYLFMHAFSGVPWLALVLTPGLLTAKDDKLLLFLASIGVLSYLVTFLNPVAATVYFFSIGLLAYGALSTEKNLLKTVGIRLMVVGVALLMVLQVASITLGRHHLIMTEIYDYTVIQLNSPANSVASESLRSTEIENNSLLNVVRFATGWMELNDTDSKNLFTYKDLYQKNIIFIIAELLPLALAVIWYAKNKKDKRLLYILLSATLLSSSYFLIFIGGVPFLSDAWRWPTSKMWPLLLIPTLLVIGQWFDSDSIPKKLKIGIIILTLVPAFIWATGTIVTPRVQNILPAEYLLLKELKSTDTVLILPKPQKAFFRSYTWGYYGTDFLGFMTKATVIDGTRTDRNNINYEIQVTNANDTTMSNVNYVLVDKTVPYSEVSQSMRQYLSTKTVVRENHIFTLYKLNAHE